MTKLLDLFRVPLVISLLFLFSGVSNADNKEFWIDIPTYLDKIRNQFEKAVESHKSKKNMPLYIEKVHIELSVIVKKVAGGGINIYVVDVDGGVEQSKTQTLSFDVYLTKPEKSALETNLMLPDDQSRKSLEVYLKSGDKVERVTDYPQLLKDLNIKGIVVEPTVKEKDK